MEPYHMTPAPSRAEAERWLAIAEKLLAGRDLVGSKTFAIRARESDPRLEAADQILAVADTLIAADKRINGSHPDWYSLLQLPRLSTDLDLIATHYRRLAILLNPNRSRLCFADHAFQLVSDAWSVLSNPNRKAQYDYDITFAPPPPPQQPPIPEYPSYDDNNNNNNINNNNNNNHNQDDTQENPNYNSNPPTQEQYDPSFNSTQENPNFNNSSNNGNNKDSTFWTACPYCYNMYEYPRQYEECTMRCQNCRRAFHGAKIEAPPEGDGETYSTWGFYPLGVSMSTMEKNKGGVAKWTPFSPMFSCPIAAADGVKTKTRVQRVPRVYIDDDEDDDDFFMDDSDQSSEDSDDEWGSTRRTKKKKGTRGRPTRRSQRENVKSNTRGATTVAMEVGPAEDDAVVSVQNGPKGAVNLGKKQMGKVPKEWGKLDLNVEFSNEGEEAAPKVVREGTARPAHGEEDGGIEGIGFFEGLDEFLSSLPILNVVGDDKVKAA